MKIRITIISLVALLWAGCSGDRKEAATTDTLPTATPDQTTAVITTDTLQFLHFDGNMDYWYAYFLNSKKDTVTLVTDDNSLNDKLLGKLLQVKWKPDTLFEAGDNDRAYDAKRLLSYTEIQGQPFAKPLTEQKALQAVKDLEEFKANADRAGVSEKPTADNRYYQIETSTEADGNLSRFKTFRVYFYPKYEIKVYDPADDKELSLDEWRKAGN